MHIISDEEYLEIKKISKQLNKLLDKNYVVIGCWGTPITNKQRFVCNDSKKEIVLKGEFAVGEDYSSLNQFKLCKVCTDFASIKQWIKL